MDADLDSKRNLLDSHKHWDQKAARWPEEPKYFLIVEAASSLAVRQVFKLQNLQLPVEAYCVMAG